MAKYVIASEWTNVSLQIQDMATLQKLAVNAAKAKGLNVRPGDIVRFDLKSSGKMALAVFRPEGAEMPVEAELPKAKIKAPTELPAGLTPEMLAQFAAILLAVETKASKAKAKRKA